MKTFALVSYSRVGDMVTVERAVEVAERDPKAFARELSADAVCFSYCDTPGLPDFSHNPERQYVERINESPVYFIDAAFLDGQAVRQLDMDEWYMDNLLWALENRGKDVRIAKTRVAHVYLVAQPTDLIVSAAA